MREVEEEEGRQNSKEGEEGNIKNTFQSKEVGWKDKRFPEDQVGTKMLEEGGEKG